MPNYNYVIDNSFQPFSMQEMLVPLTMYKDAYEKSEEQYLDLYDKADKFKYLSETLPKDSKARKLYEGYANDLSKQAEDLAHNGLSMSNRRALTSLKRRYSGEIGRLALADEAMQQERKLRQSLNAQDSSRLYAIDNLNIDDFLDGSNPNLYNISGNELYTRGATAGKSASSRIFTVGDNGATLGGYYRDWVQKMGYSPESINAFRQNISSIPELQMAADSILEERGVNQNLTGYNLQRARQSVINGIIDGAVYQEQHSPQRDLGVMDVATSAQLALSRDNQALQAASNGMKKVNGQWVYDPNSDPAYKKAVAVAEIKANNKSGRGSSSSSEYSSQIAGRTKIKWNGNDPALSDEDANDLTIEAVANDESSHPGDITNYDDLPGKVQAKVAKIIGNSSVDNYDIYYKPFKGGFWNDDEAELEIVPRKIIKTNKEDNSVDMSIH